MAETVSPPRHHPRSHMHLLPHTPLGWWGFGLMLFTVVSPLLVWAVGTPLIKHSDPDATIRTAMTIAIAVPSIVVGTVALYRREARSVLLVVISAIVAIEIAWAVFFVVSFGNA